ncbi:RNase adapter RapZ [Thermovibrio ammonificans]|uniref:Uncharacterized protein n=1 Tax=Thermovibrio ammonificans (strain DSM 15698 / JCM 12110 / HB-1) TaxID=648996 RepID=E8T3J3_THEA1|nr:RNase adapter RapZ [Thermovibrio ammonificans]ADU96124.1 hypothetical protein Theam_0151 [Thermovibrio ammonificans HB-1]
MKQIVVLTGESGAGKTSALRHLEDLGFYAIDNIPLSLVEELIDLIEESSKIEKAVLVVDARSPEFEQKARELFSRLKERHPNLSIWYLTARKEKLLNRFKETRRPHPFQRFYPDKNLEELIEREKEVYEKLFSLFDRTIDTTNLTVHDLKRLIKELLLLQKPQLQVTFLSFGFKFGVPQTADNVFDVRFLPNPHFVPELKRKTGMDQEVADYIFRFPESQEALKKIKELVLFTLPQYEKEGKAYVTYAVGCTGGQHRSVAFAEILAEEVAREFPEFQIFVEHREQGVRRRVSEEGCSGRPPEELSRLPSGEPEKGRKPLQGR